MLLRFSWAARPAKPSIIGTYLKAGKTNHRSKDFDAFHCVSKKEQKPSLCHWTWKEREFGWEKALAKRILCETWVNHHGVHATERSRSLSTACNKMEWIIPSSWRNDIWCPEDVILESKAFLRKAEVQSMDNRLPNDCRSARDREKSVMPIAWTKLITIGGGKPGMAFADYGFFIGVQKWNLRRLVINAPFGFWHVGDDYVGTLKYAIVGRNHRAVALIPSKRNESWGF